MYWLENFQLKILIWKFDGSLSLACVPIVSHYVKPWIARTSAGIVMTKYVSHIKTGPLLDELISFDWKSIHEAIEQIRTNIKPNTAKPKICYPTEVTQ